MYFAIKYQLTLNHHFIIDFCILCQQANEIASPPHQRMYSLLTLHKLV